MVYQPLYVFNGKSDLYIYMKYLLTYFVDDIFKRACADLFAHR